MYPYDQTNHQMYERYAQAHDTGDYEGIDHGQAVGHVQQFMQQAPPEVQQQVYQQHFAQMPYEQRQQFAQQAPPPYQGYMDPTNPQQMAQGFYQMGQQQPGLVQQLLAAVGGQHAQSGQGGQGGFLGSPLGKAAAVGLAALAAKQVLGGHQRGGGLGGSLLGGGLGGAVGNLLGGGQTQALWGGEGHHHGHHGHRDHDDDDD